MGLCFSETAAHFRQTDIQREGGGGGRERGGGGQTDGQIERKRRTETVMQTDRIKTGTECQSHRDVHGTFIDLTQASRAVR